MKTKRAVCLNCIDGRAQLPIINWIRKNYNVDYVDMITEPGMDGLLSDEANPLTEIKKKLMISIEKNFSSMIFAVGHYDCKGNPVSDSIHKAQVILAVERIKKEFPKKSIIGVWLNENWQCEVVG